MSVVDPTVRTSRVFEATLAVYDKLVTATFAAHPTTAQVPSVFLASDPGWEQNEYVFVIANDDPATSEWTAVGPAQSDEVIVIDVGIRSMIVAETARAVVERLEALADVVQLISYDVITGKPKPVGFTNEANVGRANDVTFSVDQTADGYIGLATVRFRLQARI